MGDSYVGNKKIKLYVGNIKIKKGYIGSTRVYSAGNTVTYYVDVGKSYTEEVDSDASCLNPKTFTPTMSGWSFVGWREDATASNNILNSKIMADSPITLYAVFKKDVTVTYYNNSTSANSSTGYRYYNNGNVVNPSFTLGQAVKDGWTARGWSTGSAGNSGITYNNNATFSRDSNITLYGMYHQVITCSFISNGTVTLNGTRYYNSNGNTINASVTAPSGVSRSGWSWRGWSAAGATTANTNVAYNNGSTISGLTNNATFYGLYYQSLSVTYYNGNTGASSIPGTRYYSSSGSVVNPTFTLTQNAMSGWSSRGWSTSSLANASVTHSSGKTYSYDANLTLYALYQRTLYLYYNGNGATSGSTGTQSGINYLSASGSTIYPTISLSSNGFARSGYSFNGWSINGGKYSIGNQISLTNNMTAYAIWTRNAAVIFDKTADFASGWDDRYYWSVPASLNGAVEYTNLDNYVSSIDCTDYKYCTVRVYAQDKNSRPSSQIQNHVYLYLSFSKSSSGTNFAHKTVSWVDSQVQAESGDGAAYNKWADITIDISALNGVQHLYCYQTGPGYGSGNFNVWCSKITMS